LRYGAVVRLAAGQHSPGGDGEFRSSIGFRWRRADGGLPDAEPAMDPEHAACSGTPGLPFRLLLPRSSRSFSGGCR